MQHFSSTRMKNWIILWVFLRGTEYNAAARTLLKHTEAVHTESRFTGTADTVIDSSLEF